MPGGLAAGRLLRCQLCREQQRCKEAADLLVQSLASRGGQWRQQLLLGALEFKDVKSLIQRGLVYNGRAPSDRAASRIVHLAQVPIKRPDGQIQVPALAHQVRAACVSVQPSSPSGGGIATCTQCGLAGATSTCLLCGESWCEAGAGCDPVPEEFSWHAEGQRRFLCPSCLHASCRKEILRQAQQGAATKSAATAAMDALAACPTPYPLITQQQAL